MVQGAETTLFAALSSELEYLNMSGEYLEDSAVKKPSRAARNASYQEHLWQLTEGLLQPWLTVKEFKNIEPAIISDRANS